MIRIVVGMFLVFGAVGNQDFYDECLMAADCVAGDPPSLIGTAVIGLLGLALAFWGSLKYHDECR
jgi:hypothetical protein